MRGGTDRVAWWRVDLEKAAGDSARLCAIRQVLRFRRLGGGVPETKDHDESEEHDRVA